MWRLVCAGVSTLIVSAAASVVDANPILSDLVFVSNGDVTLVADHFDNGLIEPFWQPIGSPGPEHDTYVDLDLGDGLQTSVIANPNLASVAMAGFDLSMLTSGSLAILRLTGSNSSDILALAIGSDGAFLVNEGSLLGTLPLANPTFMNLSIALGTDGNIGGFVNGQPVFAGPDTFGPLTGVAIQYVPEPSSMLGFGAALLVMGIGRRAGQARYRTRQQ